MLSLKQLFPKPPNLPFPYRHSSLPYPIPSLPSTLKSHYLRSVGIDVASKHLLSYPFPTQFYSDIAPSLSSLWGNIATHTPISPQIDALFKGREYRMKIHPHSAPVPSITSVSITYGPNPIPPEYTTQKWFFYNLIIPESQSQFTSYPDQKALLKQAQDQGVVIEVNVKCHVKSGIKVEIWDKVKNVPVVVDTRHVFDVVFTSPHFNPWDEIFLLDSDGTWKLAWDWRIVDLDGLVKTWSK